ncbi:MAG: cobalamin-independent methionine synthase II family protein [Actinomycetota bacterium]|jgi:5-methyltetrahydropteroyltriglutamate--homocysteine methyltransferase|nr:cobalamin-independent methionine synthase II family protein [Actinomycetota bacterium]
MSARPHEVLPTTVIGSHPQPDWLIDREALRHRAPPRIRAHEIWRVAPEHLLEAQDDATLLAIRDMEDAGIDIITDGEMRRESYSNHFSNALEGVDPEVPGEALTRTGRPDIVPLMNGPIRRKGPVEVDSARFLLNHTDRATKVTVPGPFTMSQQAQNDYYPSRAELAMALADALNEEIRDLFAAGVDIVQIDEPYMQSFVDDAQEYAVEAINRSLTGVEGTTVLHTCFGYGHFIAKKTSGYPFLSELAGTDAHQLAVEAAQPDLDLSVLDQFDRHTIVLGVIDLAAAEPESAETVADRIRAALQHVPAERLVLAPDCGMKYLPRPRARQKLEALSAGAALVRDSVG